MEGEIGDITYKRVRDTDAFRRVHVLVTERIVRIPSEDAKGYFDAEEARLAALRDEKDGVTRLPLGDDHSTSSEGRPRYPLGGLAGEGRVRTKRGKPAEWFSRRRHRMCLPVETAKAPTARRGPRQDAKTV